VSPREIRVERTEGAAVVVLVGEHDAYSADRLQRELALLLADRTPIVVDLGEATFVDSATIGVLLAVREQAGANGIPLELALPPSAGQHVRRLLATTKLDTVFSIHDSRDEAIADAAVSRDPGEVGT
jgi:anti-sigma B factor antagonist